MRFGLIVMLAFVVGNAAPFAQQPATTDTPPVTILTGCLRSSGADTAVAGPSGRIYTLEVVEPPAKTPTTTGEGTAPPAVSTTRYSLAAPESVGLDKHVDHEVQLTGTLQRPSKSATAPPTSSAGAAEPNPKPGGGHRTFEVTALKMVASKCR